MRLRAPGARPCWARGAQPLSIDYRGLVCGGQEDCRVLAAHAEGCFEGDPTGGLGRSVQ